MSEFLRFEEIKKTRKARKCFACGEIIEAGSSSYNWVCVDEDGISSSYLHSECGKDIQNHCFACNICNYNNYGFPERFFREAMFDGQECEPIKRLKELEIDEDNGKDDKQCQ